MPISKASRMPRNYVPNLFVSQFSPPRVSNPYIRGIGARGRNSPGVSTYIDGVPQLSYSTSNIAFVDIDRLEFLRGPQSTLYGRNALGGVINVYSQQPGNKWEGDLDMTGGSYSEQRIIAAESATSRPPGQGLLRCCRRLLQPRWVHQELGHDNNLDNRNDLFGRIGIPLHPRRSLGPGRSPPTANKTTTAISPSPTSIS